VIVAGRLLTGGRSFEGWIEVRGDRISDAGRGSPPARPNHRGAVVAPGLCDVQVNGAAGRTVTEGSGSLDAIDAAQLDHGVTSYLPTVITSSPGRASAAVRDVEQRVGDPASSAEGVHLEGPFLNPRFRGVHREDLLAKPANGEPDYYRSPAIRLVTLAPERPGALELIRALRSRRVTVSIGHTGASVDQARAAREAGASSVTHIFNAMRPLEHRSPNVPGWALTEPGILVGVIPDGVHVDPVALSLVARAAGGRVVLVTDATPASAAPPGEYHMGDVDLHREGGKVVDPEGRLAGSLLTLDEAVRRWMAFTGTSPAAAWRAASERPARLVGLASGLTPPRPADLVLLDQDLHIERVMRRGVWVR
jgi:N-acetylglucosamine-6-phosphate deacetylase